MYQEEALQTARGTVMMRRSGPLGLDAAVVMVGGVGGGFDSPAKGLYDRLANELPTLGIGAIQVCYRNPKSLHSCVQDVLAVMRHITTHGTSKLALVGHSLGGAVVVNAALEAMEDVTAVVTLATQFSGLEDINRLARPILFIHGTDDEILPAACSVSAFRMAKDPRKLELMDGATHVLNECAEQVYLLTRGWLLEHIAGAETGLAT